MTRFVVFTGSGFLKEKEMSGPTLARANKSGLDPDQNLRIRIQRNPKKLSGLKEKCKCKIDGSGSNRSGSAERRKGECSVFVFLLV